MKEHQMQAAYKLIERAKACRSIEDRNYEAHLAFSALSVLPDALENIASLQAEVAALRDENRFLKMMIDTPENTP